MAGYRNKGGGSSGGGGAVDGTISVGTFTGSISKVLGALAAQSVGILTASLAFIANLLETIGTYTLSAFSLNDDTGSGTRSVGTQTDSFPTTITNVLAAQSTGSETNSMAANSSIVATAWATTVSAVSNGGTVDWTNPTNAQGDINGTEAAIAVSAASGSMNDDLKATAFAIAPIPSGFTRTKVELLIRHRWDSTGQPLETCSFVVTCRDGSDAILSTVQTITQATASRGALATDTFDVTAAVAALTDAQLQALRVWCEADATLLAVAQGNFSWNIDAIHYRITYTKSGIT